MNPKPRCDAHLGHDPRSVDPHGIVLSLGVEGSVCSLDVLIVVTLSNHSFSRGGNRGRKERQAFLEPHGQPVEGWRPETKLADFSSLLRPWLVPPRTPLPALLCPDSRSAHPLPLISPTGPLCSILIKRFGCRVTMMLGGMLSSLGMVASSFSGSLSQLFLTAGLITGNCHATQRRRVGGIAVSPGEKDSHGIGPLECLNA